MPLREAERSFQVPAHLIGLYGPPQILHAKNEDESVRGNLATTGRSAHQKNQRQHQQEQHPH